ncbi:fungal-specific transcription factor domain-containing protein [Aspergillus cavernicola]|uniref:Fungal-specific transcription factor domain-containing protein n=1 Tax=Aspergillus cavernicola TaxID=176166 RepID=A0ABR4IQL0_9EURO
MSQDPQAKIGKSPSTAVPRKRRKRTVVTGAAHDCFTCTRSGSPCDRRRPYCSQCLECGLDCLGYKTPLTWGVGVASRGKFRGLSLPVTGAQPAPGKPNPRYASGHLEPQLPPTPTILTSQPFAQPSPASDIAYEHASAANIPSPQFETVSWRQPSLIDPANPPLTDSSTDVESGSAPGSWTGSWSLSFQAPPTAWPYSSHTEDPETDETVDRRGNSYAYHLARNHSPSFSQLLLARSVGQTPRLRYLISYYAEVIAPVIVAFDSPTNPFRTSILRMAQDSTSLQEAIATLSTSNLRQRRERGTFSTGRTEPARMSSLAHRALTDDSLQEYSDPSIPEEFAREEQYHRGMAVKELNKELADPQKRLSDSVLATLLILCLFHVCDTGVAQFKTQFAGVTKLLAIRMRTSPYVSDELKWFIRMFTWYDTMTATTNDREIQLHSRYVDMTAAPDGEWGLENLAGCDAGLFRVISQLGRLNLLSQNQELDTQPSPHIFIPTSAPPPSMAYYTPPDVQLSGLPTQANPLFPLPTPPRHGNQTQQPSSPTFWAEWFSIKQQLEAWRFPQDRLNPGDYAISPTSTHAYISPPPSPLYQSGVAPQNVEDVFHISESFRHSALLYSERLAYPDLPSSHPRIQQIVQRSMAHILVVKSDVYLLWPLFITGSECVLQDHRVFIQERCKDISKDSGFYNNLSCLELLQKIWEVNPPVTGITEDGNYITASPDNGYPFTCSVLHGVMSIDPNSGSTGQGFRWQQVMQAKRAEGEYMVV